MLAAIDGTGFITKEMAKALLTDFKYPFNNGTFYFPYQDNDPDGLANAYSAMFSIVEEEDILLFKDFEAEFVKAIRPRQDRFFLVLGVDGMEEKIALCHANDIRIFDLTRAMYPVKKVK